MNNCYLNYEYKIENPGILMSGFCLYMRKRSYADE